MKSNRIKIFATLFVLILLAEESRHKAYARTPANRKAALLLLQQQALGAFFLSDSYIWALMMPQIPLNKNLFQNDDTLNKPSPFFQNQEQRRTNYDFGDRRKTLQKEFHQMLEIDSSGQRVLNTEYFDSTEFGIPYDLELDDYLRYRKQAIESGIWDSLMTRYDLKKALSRGDLARLMATATGLSIPIPQNPLVSIFGKPEININVNGEVLIRIGWRWDSQNLGTVSAFGQTQSTPFFSQDIRINVSGGIGDKLKLSTDLNTRQSFNNNNRFKIGFDGDDDDIVKKVELGNVTFPVQSNLIGGGQTLFGLRADFQFGPLFLKTIFSQRRGERRFVDVKGGQTKQAIQIRAYDYSRNHFFVDNEYKAVWKDYFTPSTPVLPISSNRSRIKQIEVWESVNQPTDVNGVNNAVAVATLPPQSDPLAFRSSDYPETRAGFVERGRFMRLDTTKYKIDFNLGHLHIYNLRTDRTYAVAYRTENMLPDTSDDLYHGQIVSDIGFSDTLVLKLIYRQNMQPAFDTIWSRQMRNIYSINATNVNLNETNLSIWYFNQSNDSADVLREAPDKLVTIFGVDRSDPSGQARPDGNFDKLAGSPFFDPVRGEIIFPSLEPFRSGLRDYFERINLPAELADQYIYPEIYEQPIDIAKRNTARDRFIISGEVSGRSTGRIQLGGYNLAPNSVRVFLDGVQLKEFQDYIVDYYSGTLQLRNERAALPGANLKVEYEQQDIFNISTKTLAGLRADYNLMEGRKVNWGLGMTLMHYDQSIVQDRVQLGQEPVSNTVIGFDTKVNWEFEWLTRMLDMLPFYDTKAPSSLTVQGEWALILPNPNKRLSTVASDMNSPVVYLDDFEGATRNINLGLNPDQWQHSSQPIDDFIGPDDAARAMYRAKTNWFKYFLPSVRVQDVYPEQQTYTGTQNLAPLEIKFDPDYRGIYNRNPQFLDSLNPEFASQEPKWAQQPENRMKAWGGMQRMLSAFNTNFLTENIEYIEVMMKLDAYEPGKTRMFIDLGQISEDIIPNGVLNTEDGITEANNFPNGIIDAGEDVGIDALDNRGEKDSLHPDGTPWFPAPLNLEEDPARDDYFFDFGKDDQQRKDDDFNKYNNFENNSRFAETGQFPDTEVLNDNNGQNIWLDNSYFRYELKVDPNPVTNDQIAGGVITNGWVLYRIPVRRPTSRVGNPSLTNIQYVRVMYQGGLLRARIADWKLVGSQWQRIHNFQSNVSEDDSIMSIQFVSLFENSKAPDFYTLPPGVQPPRVINNPDPNREIKQNEASLAMTVRNLPYGQERMAVKILNPLDVFFYKKMKFFLHGDGAMPDNFVTGAVPKAMAFIRFGSDSSNYYEYRKPLVRGWMDLEIDFAELTAVKAVRDSLFRFDRQEFPVPGEDDAIFAIRGNPVLTRLQFVGFGIANPAQRYPNELTTTMWVNELRLINPEESSHWAGIGSANLKLADFGSINLTANHYLPNFHRLEERFGNRTTQNQFSFQFEGGFEKFIPKSFTGAKIPITYSHSEAKADPQFVANSDINLDAAARAAKETAVANGATEAQAEQAERDIIERSQSLKVQDSWAVTGLKLGLPSKHWLIDDTFNKMTFRYSYSQEYERNPVYAQRFNWMWKARADYSNSIPELLVFNPFSWAESVPVLNIFNKWKVNLLPSSVTFGLDLQRRRQTEQSRYLTFASPVIRDFTATKTAQFNWKLSENGLLSPTIDYTLNSTSTLVNVETDELGRQRNGGEIWDRMFLNNGTLLDLGLPTVHTQNITINMRPVFPIPGLNLYVKNFTGSFGTDYAWNDPLQPDPKIRDISKQASFNNKINFKMTLELKRLGEDLFKVKPASPGSRPDQSSGSVMDDLALVVKTLFFDFNKIDFNFTQANTATNPGVMGGTGLTNLWGRGMTGRASENIYGPGLPYQLGLVASPHGSFSIGPSSRFPFFGFNTDPGLRPPNGIMQDNFNQVTRFDVKTQRPLWEGATLDLSWNTDVGYNINQTVVTDENGVPSFSNVVALESFNRSFVTFPSVFGINVFNNTIENVVSLYTAAAAAIDADPNLSAVQKNTAKQNALSESFYSGLEAFSFTGGSAGKFLPSMNWGITWEGLEKWGIWSNVVKKVRLEHRYKSNYTEQVQVTDKGRVVQAQTIMYGFEPLLGVNWTFDEDKLDGILTATLRWSNTSGYNLSNAAKQTVSEQTTNDITAQASYTMKGFDWKLLGIELKNDLEFSFLFTWKKNKRSTIDVLDPRTYENNEGRTLQGDTQIIAEPRARYSLSQRLTASAFVRYEATLTEGAANPGFHSTQVGLDLRLSVAGGR